MRDFEWQDQQSLGLGRHQDANDGCRTAGDNLLGNASAEHSRANPRPDLVEQAALIDLALSGAAKWRR
jgi:hypothetical protein